MVVVQGTVVQGTVVGQPVAWEDRWGYPVGQSRPMPPMQQDMMARPSRPEDIQGAQSGWLLYSIGWLLCCCFGPVGPCFWFAVAGKHYCKPVEERKQLPNEGQVALVSLLTAIFTTALNIIMMTMLLNFLPSNVAPSSSASSTRFR